MNNMKRCYHIVYSLTTLSSVFREKMRPIVEKPYIEKNGDAWLKKINASLAEKPKK